MKRLRPLKPPLSLQRINIGTDEYFILPKRRSIIRVRQQREQASAAKRRVAASVVQKLRIIPSIHLVGITGGLAMNNASVDDDIDLFIVAAPQTLWITRLLAIFITDLLGVRRHPYDRVIIDKVCLNMFVTRDALAVPQNEQDLFTAHEVLQMIPLLNRNDTYQQFLRSNQWVRMFLPNAWEEKSGQSRVHSIQKNSFTARVLYFFLRIPVHSALYAVHYFEPVARSLQLWYMRDRRTTEVVSDTVIRFHPRDARVWIKTELTRRLARFNIPLDKFFYGG